MAAGGWTGAKTGPGAGAGTGSSAPGGACPWAMAGAGAGAGRGEEPELEPAHWPGSDEQSRGEALVGKQAGEP